MNSTDGVKERSRIVRVSHRSFLSEEIPLSTGLTQVRTSNPELRVQQAKQLYDVLERPDSKAWFHPSQLTYPLDSIRRTSFYGDRRIYRYDDGTTSRSIHIGVDYGGSQGTRIYAPGSGRVVFHGFRQVTGNTLVIEHLPSVFSLFFHLEKLLVSTGDMVEQGTNIGTLGATGLATGPHLHWELRFGTEALDPEYFLTKPLLDSYIIF
jgi:murein DD-endopeptidase MepM/ murein hydrolase activator NlpD